MDIGDVHLGHQALVINPWLFECPSLKVDALRPKDNVPNVHIQPPISTFLKAGVRHECASDWRGTSPQLSHRGSPMPLSFVLVMFLLPAAIVATAVVLARTSKEHEE